MPIWDTIIIGGAAAGLSAAIYTCRKNMKTLVISIDIGGQNLLTEQEENYPGYIELSGPKLMQIFQKQAINFGAEIIFGKATKLEKLDKNFKITMGNGDEYITKTVILSFGKISRPLNVEGENKFMGRGVHTCATCDAPFTKGKNVAVIGGGNSAFEAAELLTKFANKVYLIHRRDEFKADPITVDKIKNKNKVEIIINTIIKKINGEKNVDSLLIENIIDNSTKELKIDSVFIEIGYILDTDWVSNLVKLENRQIITNKKAETITPGIFAAGDVTNSPYKQTITAAAEGAIAGLSSYNYLRSKEGKSTISLDWK